MSASAWRAAPAKINLALHVTGRREDGYHEIDTLAVFARLADRIRIETADRDSFAIAGPFASVLDAENDNLVTRARDLLRATAPHACPPVGILLEKNLPVASGIGGGSSDAAATLTGLDAHWQLGLGDAVLARLGARLGADVPMCLAARPLRANGIGDRIKPVENWPALHLVLVNPGVPVSTPAVFSRLEHRDGSALPDLPEDRSEAAVLGWLAATRNDLERPALRLAPPIAEALASLRQAGARLARMSGSGATCFGLFPDAAAAQVAAASIQQGRPAWFVAATTTTE